MNINLTSCNGYNNSIDKIDTMDDTLTNIHKEKVSSIETPLMQHTALQYMIKDMFTDLILLFIPKSLIKLISIDFSTYIDSTSLHNDLTIIKSIDNTETDNTSTDNTLTDNFSIENLRESLSLESYSIFLKKLQTLPIKMIIAIIDHILMCIDFDSLFMNEDIYNNLKIYCNNNNFQHLHTFVIIYRMIKCIIISMIKIAIALDTYTNSIADKFMSIDNWNIRNTDTLYQIIHQKILTSIFTSFKDNLHSNGQLDKTSYTASKNKLYSIYDKNGNINDNILNLELENIISEYLITKDDIYKKKIN